MALGFRRAIGVFGGVLMALSGAAHSLAGWPAVRGEFARAGAPPDLVAGLAVPWHFAGMAMTLLGVLVCEGLVADRAGGRRPLRIIGAGYLGFAAVVALLVGPDATVLLFLVPGLMALVGTL